MHALSPAKLSCACSVFTKFKKKKKKTKKTAECVREHQCTPGSRFVPLCLTCHEWDHVNNLLANGSGRSNACHFRPSHKTWQGPAHVTSALSPLSAPLDVWTSVLPWNSWRGACSCKNPGPIMTRRSRPHSLSACDRKEVYCWNSGWLKLSSGENAVIMADGKYGGVSKSCGR